MTSREKPNGEYRITNIEVRRKKATRRLRIEELRDSGIEEFQNSQFKEAPAGGPNAHSIGRGRARKLRNKRACFIHVLASTPILGIDRHAAPAMGRRKGFRVW